MKNLRIYYKVLAFVTAAFMAAFPFISYMHVEKAKGMELEYFAKKSKILIDFFYWYKENALFCFVATMALASVLWLVIYYILRERLPEGLSRDKKLFFALGAYFLLNVISVLLSRYREYGLWGLSIDYEGLAAIFSYMVLFALGYFLFRRHSTSHMLLVSLRVLMVLLVFGAFLEMRFGPFLNVEWFRNLCSPDRYRHLLENAYWKEAEGVSLTFGNAGFFGGFCAMLLPVGLGMVVTDKKKGASAFDLLLAGGMFFCILGSASTGALYAAAGTVFLQFLYMLGASRIRKRHGEGDGPDKTKEMWKKAGAAFAGSLACGFFLLAIAQGITGIDGLFRDRVSGTVINAQYERKEEGFQIESIRLEDGKLIADGKSGTFTAEAVEDKDEMSLLDFRFTGEENVSLEVMGRILTVGFGYKDPVELYVYGGDLYYIDFNGSLLEEIPQPKMKGLEKIYPLFTGRGYIWASSVPMLIDSLIIGQGIGAFPFCYPQSEAAGMLNVHGSADYCIEQAHSWYVQTAVSSGVLSLLYMLYAIAAVLWRQFCRGVGCRKGIDAANAGGEAEWTDFLAWGLVAYTIAGIVNNSTISATPMFWLLLGVAAYRASEGISAEMGSDRKESEETLHKNGAGIVDKQGKRC